jgi:hypothetical protein
MHASTPPVSTTWKVTYIMHTPTHSCCLQVPSLTHHQVKIGIIIYGCTDAKVIMTKLILCHLNDNGDTQTARCTVLQLLFAFPSNTNTLSAYCKLLHLLTLVSTNLLDVATIAFFAFINFHASEIFELQRKLPKKHKTTQV